MARRTIFDALEPEGKQGFIDSAQEKSEPLTKGYFQSFKDFIEPPSMGENKPLDLGKDIIKGGVEGVSKLGRMMSPLIDNQGRNSEEILGQQSENLDELLPSQGTFTQRAVRRGIKEAPSVLAFPGSQAASLLPRAMAAGFLGEGAKDLGAPEWAQSALELTAFIGPDITKKLLEKGNNAEIIKAAKDLGLSDEAITPLIQNEFKQKWLAKIATKRGSIQDSLGTSKSELSNAYGKIQGSDVAKTIMTPQSEQLFYEKLESQLNQLPSELRNKIAEDVLDLRKGPVSGETLINLYQDINSTLGKETNKISLIKPIIKDALKEVDPQLSKDFNLINDLHSKYYKIASRLKPNLKTDLYEASEAIALIGSFATGYYPYFGKM